MATVTKKQGPDGKPRYDVRWRDDTRKQRTKTFKRAVDADRFKTKVEGALLEGTYIDPRKGDQTFQDYATHWLEAQGFSPKTYGIRERHLRLHLFPHIGGVKLSKITPTRLRGVITSLQVSSTYRSHIYETLDAVLTSAHMDRIIPWLPTKNPANPKPQREDSEVEAWPVEWVFSMEDVLPAEYQIMVALGAGLGLRIGEMCGLAEEDIDWFKNTVTIHRQATVNENRLVFAPAKLRKEKEKARVIPMSETVKLALAAHLAQFPAQEVELPWVLPGGPKKTHRLVLNTPARRGVKGVYSARRASQLSTVWAKARTVVGIPDLRRNGVHALRHFYGSALLQDGVNPVQVSANMGHRDTSVTLRIYAHVMPSGEDQTRASVDTFLQRPKRAEEPPVEEGEETA